MFIFNCRENTVIRLYLQIIFNHYNLNQRLCKFFFFDYFVQCPTLDSFAFPQSRKRFGFSLEETLRIGNDQTTSAFVFCQRVKEFFDTRISFLSSAICRQFPIQSHPNTTKKIYTKKQLSVNRNHKLAFVKPFPTQKTKNNHEKRLFYAFRSGFCPNFLCRSSKKEK